jgi:hypothetical protein
MRIGVVGAGLAGTLLAWRLAGPGAGGGAGPATGGGPVLVDLATGRRDRPDATGVSGGAVRGYEAHPRQRALAVASLVELLGSQTLRGWAGYRPGRSVILARDAGGPAAAVAEIDRALPGSAALCDAAELTRLGWAGLDPGTVAVREERAGRIDPDALRHSVLGHLAGRRNVTVAERLPARGYDMVVYAVGGWTPALVPGYRTKAIRYTVFRCAGWRPPIFSDGRLYGLPLDGDLLLLGVATDEWDVDPDAVPAVPAGPRVSDVDIAALARRRLPALRLGPVVRRVAAADCYPEPPEPPILALRPATGAGLAPAAAHFVFSGGSGGSA